MKYILLNRLFSGIFVLSLYGGIMPSVTSAAELTVVNNTGEAINVKVKKYTITREEPMNQTVKTYAKENIIAGDIQPNDKIRVGDVVLPDLWNIEYKPLGSSSSYSGDKNCRASGNSSATITIKVDGYEIDMPNDGKCIGKFN